MQALFRGADDPLGAMKDMEAIIETRCREREAEDIAERQSRRAECLSDQQAEQQHRLTAAEQCGCFRRRIAHWEHLSPEQQNLVKALRVAAGLS
jgi:hypothetical protein